MSFWKASTPWPGLSRLSHEQQRRYAQLEGWQQQQVQYSFEMRWRAEQRCAELARTPWQRWKAATRELLRWWWGLLA